MESQPKIRVIFYTLRLEFPQKVDIGSGTLTPANTGDTSDDSSDRPFSV